MEQYRISVIVPVYNVEKHLGKCMESLIGQEQMEIILIDDGSTDRSGQMCDEYAAQYRQIKCFHKENGGLSSARNYGIDRAKGDYIVFVDSDDYVEKSTCRRLLQVIRIFPETDIVVYHGIEEKRHNCREMVGRIPKTAVWNTGKDYLLKKCRNGILKIEAWLSMYRKSFLKDNQLRFKEGILHEDVEFTPRAILQAGKIVEIPDNLYHYVVRDNSISTNTDKTKNIRDLFQTLEELDLLAEQQDAELCRWMKNSILNSYLNMIYDARMYKKEYRLLLNKRVLRHKAATNYNRLRTGLCLLNVQWYCMANDFYKKMKKGMRK